MTDTHRENLSAGMDGELTQEELRFLLRRLDHDATLQHAWARYHVARDGLRHTLPPLASPRFSARVMQAIEQEAMVVEGGRRRHWLRWSAGGAIAASVAVAALMVAQPVGPGSDGSAPRVAAANHARDVVRAGTAPVHAETPAAAPAWLNNYASLPSELTQQASATLDGGESTLLYSRSRLNPYQVERYRAINNGDGSYLLLIPPAQKVPQAVPQQAPAAQ
ncbi:sigma-E factor negative regulatory protein [Dyella subtropica]|uniref:sigma-E factor negative regulatory protein n=1 Tax=Dyella subtropica TaxID=2992127 RepID=UPI002252CFA8|nr:sigma-E factor negative regulatory protein [Dyella subtropica]